MRRNLAVVAAACTVLISLVCTSKSGAAPTGPTASTSDPKGPVLIVNATLEAKLEECELRVATFLIKPKGHGDWKSCLDQASASVKPQMDAARSSLVNIPTAKSDFEQEAAYFDSSLVDVFPRDYESRIEYQRRMDARIDHLRDLGAKLWADVQ